MSSSFRSIISELICYNYDNMTVQAVAKKEQKNAENDEDKDLQNELTLLVNKVTGKDQSLIQPAIEMLKYLIRTSTTSMTSVPKPLKYLAPYYGTLKKTYRSIENSQLKKGIADVISLLAMGTAGGEEAKNHRECLKFCLLGKIQ